MKRIVLSLLLTFSLLGTVYAQESSSQTDNSNDTTSAESMPVAAEVSDDSVVLQLGEQTETLADFNDRFEVAIRSLAASQGVPLTPDMRAQLDTFKPQFLDRRAVEVTLLAEAEARGIVVTDEDVDARIEEISASFPEGETLESFMEQAGFASEAQLRTTLREDTLLQQVVEQLQNETIISDEAIQAAYDESPEAFSQPAQVCARHILLDTVEDAEAVLADLADGADFAELAAERSTGPSGPNGGDLGCFGEGQMVAPFEEAAFSAETGVPVGPVETQFGQHVILVYDRNEAGIAPLADVKDQLEQQLQQEAFTAQLEDLRASYGVEVFPEVLELEAAQTAAEETEPVATEEADEASGAPADTSDEASEADEASEDNETTDSQ